MPLQVTLNDLDPTFAVSLLTAIVAGTSGLDPTVASGILGPLNLVLPFVGNIISATTLPIILNGIAGVVGGIGLNTLTINAGVVATCTTATLPVGSYTGLTVAYAGEHSPSSCHLICLQ